MVLSLIGVVPRTVHAQMGRLPYGGSELFRFALHQKGIEPLTEPRAALRSPDSTIIVVLGDTASLSQFFRGEQLRDYLLNGGSILIATDSSNQNQWRGNDPGWGAQFEITITGRKLTAAPKDSYRQLPGHPFVKAKKNIAFIGGPSPHDLFAGQSIEQPNIVATEYPSEMSIPLVAPRGFRVDDVAGYVDSTRRTQDGVRVDRSTDHFAVALRATEGSGRMLVLANEKVFANGMMGFKETAPNSGDYEFDNRNWELAGRTIDWLRDGHEPKKKCLFIENGRVVDKFADKLPLPPKPPIPKLPPDVIANWLLNYANAVIPWAEENDLFNKHLQNTFGFDRLVRMFLITVTIVFLLAALRWLSRGSRKVEPTSTITKTVQDGYLPRGGVLRQRTSAQIEVGNLYEAARRRVRSRFDVLGARPNRDGKMPPLLTANDIPDGPLLHQTIRWMWFIGYGDTPVGVTAAEWDRLNSLLERVCARAVRGDWSFGQDV
jgi:hypothetical protein